MSFELFGKDNSTSKLYNFDDPALYSYYGPPGDRFRPIWDDEDYDGIVLGYLSSRFDGVRYVPSNFQQSFTSYSDTDCNSPDGTFGFTPGRPPIANTPSLYHAIAMFPVVRSYEVDSSHAAPTIDLRADVSKAEMKIGLYQSRYDPKHMYELPIPWRIKIVGYDRDLNEVTSVVTSNFLRNLFWEWEELSSFFCPRLPTQEVIDLSGLQVATLLAPPGKKISYIVFLYDEPLLSMPRQFETRQIFLDDLKVSGRVAKLEANDLGFSSMKIAQTIYDPDLPLLSIDPKSYTIPSDGIIDLVEGKFGHFVLEVESSFQFEIESSLKFEIKNSSGDVMYGASDSIFFNREGLVKKYYEIPNLLPPRLLCCYIFLRW